MSFSLDTYLQERKTLVNEAIFRLLPPASEWPETLHRSMHYSLEAGGKRLRPILCIAAAEALGKTAELVLPVAVALEMIHTYSLIHDDLPAMDNDDLRRGKPTNHKIFGEAVAILAGDALLTLAFSIMARHRHPELDLTRLVQVIEMISEASGSAGMVGGQVVDLESEHKQLTLSTLEKLHQSKTGKLIRASLAAGATLGGAQGKELDTLKNYGEKIGLAFQIADDVLDLEGGVEIGKDLGSDLEKEKSTYPRLLGIEGSKQLAATLIEEAQALLTPFGERAEPLRQIARYVVLRKS